MWAAAPVGDNLRVSSSGKISRSKGAQPRLALMSDPHVSLHIHSICEVQERLPEMPASSSVFPGEVVEHQLESLILAQNERWRHA
jgi:hypothetical protein